VEIHATKRENAAEELCICNHNNLRVATPISGSEYNLFADHTDSLSPWLALDGLLQAYLVTVPQQICSYALTHQRKSNRQCLAPRDQWTSNLFDLFHTRTELLYIVWLQRKTGNFCQYKRSWLISVLCSAIIMDSAHLHPLITGRGCGLRGF
jgi:hypothetical protein